MIFCALPGWVSRLVLIWASAVLCQVVFPSARTQARGTEIFHPGLGSGTQALGISGSQAPAPGPRSPVPGPGPRARTPVSGPNTFGIAGSFHTKRSVPNFRIRTTIVAPNIDINDLITVVFCFECIVLFLVCVSVAALQ